jgi:hypothetical protein
LFFSCLGTLLLAAGLLAHLAELTALLLDLPGEFLDPLFLLGVRRHELVQARLEAISLANQLVALGRQPVALAGERLHLCLEIAVRLGE